MRDFSVPGSTVIAQRAAAPLRFASVKSTHKALHTSRLSFIGGVREERELSRPSEMYSQTLCRFKLICVRSRTLTSIDSLFMEALVVSVRMMKLILYLTAWPHRYPASLPILCCERLKTRNMSQMRHKHPTWDSIRVQWLLRTFLMWQHWKCYWYQSCKCWENTLIS